MATKKQILDRAELASNQLHKIRSLIGLCGFAAEARRTLHDIDLAAEISPETGRTLAQLVPARNQYLEYEDNLSSVLNEVDSQMEAVIELVESLRVWDEPDMTP